MEATITNSLEMLPDEMKEYQQWILYKKVWKEKEQKYTKVPKQINGFNASSTNSQTWTNFNTVLKVFNNDKANRFNGLGFVFTQDDPFVGIDLDDCFKNGELLKDRNSIVNSADSYTEISQSGEGLHIIVKGEDIGKGFNNQSEGVEMYSNGRFFAATGDLWRDSPRTVNDHDDLVRFLDDSYRPKNEKSKSDNQSEDQPQTLDDDVLIDKILKSKQPEKFIDLYYYGDVGKYFLKNDGEPDWSKGDYSLANTLAWWTKNSAQIERIMRQSALYRDKWDEHPDYLKGRTIQGAMGNNEDIGYGVDNGFYLYVNEDSKKTEFVLNEDDSIKKTLYNLKQMIMTDKNLNGLGFNEFTEEVTINGRPITDFDISEIRLNVDFKYQLTFKKDDIIDVLNSVSREKNSYHPIKQMIESKQWDGTPRAETIFIDYLGAIDDHYMRSVARKWLAGAVARIYEPGIKMDIVPVLQGGQGIGKSTMAGKLGGDYFVDSLMSLGNSKDDYQMLIDSWVIELSELSSVNSTQIEKVKGFISTQSDKIRMPYGKVTRDYKRTCAFIGTTNTSQFLNDLTGNRRFFPIPLFMAK